MELIASLFCHAPDGLPEVEVQQELRRQHDVLARYAADAGRMIEHCFFHVGAFEPEKPDEVLLRFLQRAQAGDLGLVLAENRGCFPLSRQNIPRMEVYFVQEKVRKILGREDVRVDQEKQHPKNIYMYRGV